MDIKPENFMFPTKNSKTLKMIDFGLSQTYCSGFPLTKVSGTVYYIAPEVLTQKYTSKCDIWSIGVILYFMITGKLPYDGDSEEEIMDSLMQDQYDLKLFTDQKT